MTTKIISISILSRSSLGYFSVLEQEECYDLNHQSPSIPVNTFKAEQNQYSCRFYQNEFSKKPDSPVVKLEKERHKNFTHAQLPRPNVSLSVSQPLDYGNFGSVVFKS